jgi:hypothetical protein
VESVPRRVLLDQLGARVAHALGMDVDEPPAADRDGRRSGERRADRKHDR